MAEVGLLLGFALFMSGADEAPLRPVDLSALARPCVNANTMSMCLYAKKMLYVLYIIV